MRLPHGTGPRRTKAVPAWPTPFTLTAPARPEHVAGLRRALGGWLETDDVPPAVVEDLVLAVSEALENCCDHAFAAAVVGGTMTMSAREGDDRVVVTVADDGRWQPPRSGPSHRGRGLTLIRTLADEVTLRTAASGTCLTFCRDRSAMR